MITIHEPNATSATDHTHPAEAATFAALRPRLFSIAHRMLGTRADADDVMQDAWLRWNGADRAQLQSADAWLVTVTTRLAIDRLRSRKSEREACVGWWLPEPLVEFDDRTPETAAELASDVSVAFMWLLASGARRDLRQPQVPSPGRRRIKGWNLC